MQDVQPVDDGRRTVEVYKSQQGIFYFDVLAIEPLQTFNDLVVD